jgi:hypothetical protein
MIMTAQRLEKHGFCDSLSREVISIKEKLGELVGELEGSHDENLEPYVRHLHEMINFIDWKIEIFSKVCPVDWKSLDVNVESTVSVPPIESSKEKDLPAGGYVGG